MYIIYIYITLWCHCSMISVFTNDILLLFLWYLLCKQHVHPYGRIYCKLTFEKNIFKVDIIISLI